MRVMSRESSNGVSSDQLGLSRLMRPVPEGVPAALGDGVDHTAGEPAACSAEIPEREDLRLFDGVLDEQVLRRPEQVVDHVHAIST